MSLTLSNYDKATLAALNLSQSSDPFSIIRSLSKFYNHIHDYRSAFRVYKFNPEYAQSLEYVSYMIFFNEFNTNAVPEYESLILKIIRYKLKPESSKQFSTEGSARQESLDERYHQYKMLTDNDLTLDEVFRHLYKMFVKGTEYSYKKVIENIRGYERLDVIKIVLGKYDVPELRHIYKEIVMKRKKDKFDIIMSVLSNNDVNIEYLSEISDYQIEKY